MALSVVLLGAKVPVPFEVQIPVVVPPEIVPASVAVVFAQIVWSTPALTVVGATNSEKYPYSHPVTPPPFTTPNANTSIELETLKVESTGT